MPSSRMWTRELSTGRRSMTSERKQKANRANARSSTGPKTAKGKARSAKNALRHGLNSPVLKHPALAKEVERIASHIAGEGASGALLARARAIAEAQIDLQRVRTSRLRRSEITLASSRSVRADTEPPIGLSEIAAAEWQLKRMRGIHKRLRVRVRAVL